MTNEEKARAALEWALENTCMAIADEKQTSAGWTWDEDDKALIASGDDGDFRFHVAVERRGVRYIRIAVLSWVAEAGSMTWKSPIPDYVIGVVV